MKKLEIFDRYKTPAQWKERALNMGKTENNEIKVRNTGLKFAVAFASIAVIVGSAAIYGFSKINKTPQTGNKGDSSIVINSSDSNTDSNVSTSQIDSSSQEESSSQVDLSSQEESSSQVDLSSQEESSSQVDLSSQEESSSQVDELSSQEDSSSQADFSSKKDNSSKNDSSSKKETTAVKTKKSDNINITGENLLNLNVEDVLEKADNKYQLVYSNFTQQGVKNMYKCNSFPAYCFRGTSINEGKTSGKITCVNLYTGAYINDKIKVGMTFNQLKELNGGKLEIYILNCNVDYCAYVEVNGHKWLIGFDLTQEQKDEIRNRIIEKAGGEENLYSDFSVMLGTGVDISDINPTSNAAAYSMD